MPATPAKQTYATQYHLQKFKNTCPQSKNPYFMRTHSSKMTYTKHTIMVAFGVGNRSGKKG